jgi:regulator of protease activity HflC (stomatin/prohibitin superfamily)
MSNELNISAVVGVVIVLVVAITLFRAIKVVPQGIELTIERFGRYTHTLKPGLGLILPYIDRVGGRVDMREQVLPVPRQEVITRDNALVTADGVAFYQVLDAARATYEVADVHNAILNLTMTNLRTVMGSLDLDELLSQRDQINVRLLTVLDQATSPWGIKLTRIEIKDITPPVDLVESMGRQMKAERDRRAAILEAEGIRQSEILRAEGAKQAAILEAEGRREAAFRDAEARERLAEAEANATTKLSAAVKSGDALAIQYFLGQKYIEALAGFAASPQQKTVFLPLDATGVMSALGGIGEIAQAAFNRTPPAAPPPAPVGPWGAPRD